MSFSGSYKKRAFTLIELLVVIVIIAVLVGISLPIYGRILQQSAITKTTSNTRQMGAAMILYAGDNNYQLPSRVTNNPDPTQPTPSKWPTLLKPYIQNLAVYTSPLPNVQTGPHPGSYKVVDQTQYFNNNTNFSTYIYNGFNDMHDLNDSSYVPRINMIARTSSTILLGIPYPQTGQFYMDFSEGAGNNNEILNRTAFPNGSVYMFCDGSARLLKYDPNSKVTDMQQEPTSSGTYSDWYWLADKSRISVIK